MTKRVARFMSSSLALALAACAGGGVEPAARAELERDEALSGGDTTNSLLLGTNAFTRPAANLSERARDRVLHRQQLLQPELGAGAREHDRARRARPDLQRALVQRLPLQGRPRRAVRRRRLGPRALAAHRSRRRRAARRTARRPDLRRSAAGQRAPRRAGRRQGRDHLRGARRALRRRRALQPARARATRSPTPPSATPRKTS